VQELIRQFGVDWKLLLAQVVNFLVLLYLLKRFAYGPVIAMLHERRRKIEEGLKASEDAKKRLAAAEQTRTAIILKAEEEAVGLVSQAEETAKDQAKTIVNAAEAKSEQVLISGQKKLEEERLKLEDEVRSNAHDLVKTALASTLQKMNPTERDEALIEQALKALKTVHQ
jgi:F-type H+-transporting ATPase subunit b